MSQLSSLIKNGMVLAMVVMSTACIVEPRNDYYDRDHHRYYHDHGWHECGDHNDYCR